MKYKKGDRVLFNRLKFGNVYQDQSNAAVINVTFDREHGVIQGVRADLVELVSDPQHEARLAAMINAPLQEYSIAGELLKMSEELSNACANEKNALKLRTIMTSVALRLRGIAEDM